MLAPVITRMVTIRVKIILSGFRDGTCAMGFGLRCKSGKSTEDGVMLRAYSAALKRACEYLDTVIVATPQSFFQTIYNIIAKRGSSIDTRYISCEGKGMITQARINQVSLYNEMSSFHWIGTKLDKPSFLSRGKSFNCPKI